MRSRVQMKMNSDRQAQSISSLADDLGLGRSFLYQEIKAGRLQRVKAGSRSLVTRRQRDAYIALLEAEAEAEAAKLGSRTLILRESAERLQRSLPRVRARNAPRIAR